MTVAVEPATLADVDAIRRLDGLSPASARLLEAELGRSDRCCLVARVCDVARDAEVARGGEVVGYAAAAYHLDEAEILDVAVDAAWRRQGIATALLGELDRRLRAAGVDGVTLEVREDGAGAQALYRGLGFVVEGRRPGYYPDGTAALIMWRRPGKER